MQQKRSRQGEEGGGVIWQYVQCHVTTGQPCFPPSRFSSTDSASGEVGVGVAAAENLCRSSHTLSCRYTGQPCFSPSSSSSTNSASGEVRVGGAAGERKGIVR